MTHLGRSAFVVGMLTVMLSGTASSAPTVVVAELLNPTPERTVQGTPLTTRTIFESSPVDLRRVDFESLTIGSRPSTFDFTGSAGTTSAQLSLSDYCLNSTAQRCGVNNDSSVGRYNTTGATTAAANPGRWWDADGGFTLSFTDAITAFGFYGTDFGDLQGVLSIDLFREGTDSAVETVPVNHTATSASSKSLVFWGFEDAIGYRTIRFNIRQVGTDPGRFDVFGFDDMVIGRRATSSVPEPATLALTAISLGALVASRRRRTTHRA
ncbi:MAG: PEP-CTERM sorting domain-containing protein [Betaproteobacteria bacterium]|nr:PEP-CTERM sorting domain-containing protein [Betaproteobacteria bacterium]